MHSVPRSVIDERHCTRRASEARDRRGGRGPNCLSLEPLRGSTRSAGLPIFSSSTGVAERGSTGARFGRAFGRDACKPLNRIGRGALRSGFQLPVRDRFGRAGQFGRPSRKPFPVFGLLAPKLGLRRTENPRVGGSIPPLATTSTWCIPIRWLHLIPDMSVANYRQAAAGS